ncbi:conserved hypothetical protein [Luminiphilus syltensis NOR5-1B]|uniref:DUF3806 domain-containing protein n=2 Tax=Luminiphilus TaxID=1341118 RepID=B8KQB6_9GAMM|nr:conserved hypothetical protein [Luminiphilus syltensis NOR5-1B]
MCVLMMVSMPTAAQGSKIERRIDPLSAIDRQFMAGQRQTIEALANQQGRQLTGDPDRDIDTLQAILDRGLVARDDTLTLQAMGIVLGDLLGSTLDMDWVVYRDRAGRSRALRYRDREIFLYPVTMISKRWEAGSQRPIASIYAEAVSKTKPLLPGARWR